jgi:hypothetical protein
MSWVILSTTLFLVIRQQHTLIIYMKRILVPFLDFLKGLAV